MTTRQAVPDGVKRQKEEADKLLEDFEKQAAAQAKPGEPAPGGSQAEPQPGAEPPAAEPAPAPAQDDEVTTLKAQIVQLSDALQKLQGVITDENNGTWKHKYSVMDGKYRAETAPALRRVHELDERVKALEAENADLKAKGGAKPAKAPAAADPANVTDIDRETADAWGVAPEQLAAYRRSITESVIAALKPQMQAATEPPPAAAAGTEPPAASGGQDSNPALIAYNALLDTKARGWREAMQSKAFVAYLKANPGQYAELQAADQRLDSDAVAKVYNDYFSSGSANAAQAPAAQAPASRESGASAAQGGGSAPATAETWSLERIAQFETDIASGKIKMGSELYKKLKASRDAFLDGMVVR